MKKIIILLFGIAVTISSYAQPTLSDNHTPVPVPPPLPRDTTRYPPDTTKKCISKLVSFSLPCCISATTDVASIAKVTFSNKACPAPAVTYTPATLSPISTKGVDEQRVMAEAGDVKLFSSVSVVNESVVEGAGQLSLGPVKDLKTKADNLLKALTAAPCAPSGSLIPSGSASYSFSNICCKTAPCVKYVPKYAVALTWGYGMTCHFPIFGVPWFVSLDAVLSANTSLAVSLTYQDGCTPSQACADINGGITIGGGVGGTLLGGLGSAELQLTGSGSLSGNWCVYPEVKTPTGNFTFGAVQVQGSISTGWGLISHTVSFTLFSGFSASF